MNSKEIYDSFAHVDEELLCETESASRSVFNKKRIVLIFGIIIIISLISVIYFINAQKIYKRVSFGDQTLGDGQDWSDIVSRSTKIEMNNTDTFDTAFPVYKITPHVFNAEDVKRLAECFGVTGVEPVTNVKDSIGIHISRGRKQIDVYCTLGEIGLPTLVYMYNNDDHYESREMTQTVEELESAAREIFSKLQFIDGEYEYVGITSTQTVSKPNGPEIQGRRLSFRRLINGTRVVGNGGIDMYFNIDGLEQLRITAFDYEQIDTLDMIPLNTALKKVKDPDGYSIDWKGSPDYTGKADSIVINQVKLLYVNQYSEGCTILQPVYNFIGEAVNESGEIHINARIIAIPEKYTYD